MVQPVEGLVGETFRMPIEEGKVLEFIESLGLSSWTSPFVPPTFLISAFFWERRVIGADVKQAIAFDPARSVHAEQCFEFFGAPPRIGQTLSVQNRVDRIYTKTNRRGAELTFVDIVTDYRDETGDRVATSTLRAIELPKDTP